MKSLRAFISLCLLLLLPSSLLFAQITSPGIGHAIIKKSIRLAAGKGEPLATGFADIKAKLAGNCSQVTKLYLWGENLQEGRIYRLYLDGCWIATGRALSERVENRPENPSLIFDLKDEPKDDNEILLSATNIDRIEVRDQDERVVLWGDLDLSER